MQLKWLEWKNNGAELSTTDIELYNGAEFGQSSGFMLSMVKQLESPWNRATMCSKYFDTNMSRIIQAVRAPFRGWRMVAQRGGEMRTHDVIKYA